MLAAARIVPPKARKKADSCGDLRRSIRVGAQCDSIEHYAALANRVVDQMQRRVLHKQRSR